MKDQNTLTQEDFSKVPSNRLFHFTLISSTKKRAEISIPLAETYLQEGGVVHGGVISSLADTAAVYTLPLSHRKPIYDQHRIQNEFLKSCLI